MSYCAFCLHLDKSNVHRHYHDEAYGFPIDDDHELFGRLIMEINQAGLSWETILKKEEGFRSAYFNFEIEKIAAFEESDINRLLDDPGVIRNRLKINAAVHNAKVISDWRSREVTFKNWLDNNHPLTKDEWVRMFKKNFKFVGGEIVNEFLMSTGYLKGAHVEDCAIFDKILSCKPKWNEK